MRRHLKSIFFFCLICAAIFLFASSKKSSDENKNDKQSSPELTLAFPQQFPSRDNLRPHENGQVPLEGTDITVDTSLPRKDEGKRLFKLYKEKYIDSGAKGRMILDTISALNLEKSAENVKSVQQLLKSKITNDEKVALTSILASFYSHDDVTGLNKEILSDLKDLLYSGNAEIGREAALSYSRLGYFTDSENILAYAKKSGYIGDQEYYGDLAYLLAQSPQDAQIRIINNIKAGQNGFSVEVLSSLFQNQDIVKKLSPLALDTIKSFVIANEPKFPDGSNEFGLIDAIRYGDWLRSVAMLNNVVNNEKEYSQFIISQINKGGTDPRKVAAFFISPDGEQLIGSLDQLGALGSLREKVAAYAQQNSQNVAVREILENIDNNVRLLQSKKSH